MPHGVEFNVRRFEPIWTKTNVPVRLQVVFLPLDFAMQAEKLAPGNMLLQFRLSAQIGTGGMGVVWKAFDTALERHVALKCLPADFSNEPAHLARFEREARLLAALNHPNVATIYGLHTADGLCFLTMELVDGRDLRRHLLKTGALPLTTALRVAADTAAGLAAAHAVGIIHRDLKPGNICLTAAGTAKVVDFGLSKRSLQPDVDATTESADMSGTTPGTVLGTAKYMSPEQARGELADLRCDVWAFGAVVYQMLVGDPPFTGRSYAEVIGAVLKDEPNWDKLPSGTPETIRTLLVRCLTKSADDRPPDILGPREIVVDALTRSIVDGPESYLISSVAVLPFVNMSANPTTQDLRRRPGRGPDQRSDSGAASARGITNVIIWLSFDGHRCAKDWRPTERQGRCRRKREAFWEQAKSHGPGHGCSERVQLVVRAL